MLMKKMMLERLSEELEEEVVDFEMMDLARTFYNVVTLFCDILMRTK